MVHSTSDIISSFEAEQRNTVFSALSEYLSTGQYVDISLVCKGQVLRAHKVVLSSSSKYFKDFFRHRPGVNIIDLDKELAPNDLSLTLEDVQLIIGILYCVGTVEISPQRIETLLICAQVLGIPTLISFLKKIRDSIGDSGKIVKERDRATLPGLPLLSPRHKILSSRTGRRNSSDMMYLLPSPATQYPPTIYPPHTPINSLQPSSTFSPGTFSRAGDSPSPRSPLLDLSVVKPMTASCVPSPEMTTSGPSPVAGPSGLNRAGVVQDSLLSLSTNVPKLDPEPLYRRESSRISTASYSSFTLNYLGSPRLKSTEVPANENHQSLDGFDQNFFMSLNTLQANQIDDLENVLLPHLSMDRPEQPLLDLNNIDGVENNQEEDNDISTTTTTSPEEETPSTETPTLDISGGVQQDSEPMEGEDDRHDTTIEESEEASDAQTKEYADTNPTDSEKMVKPTDHQVSVTHNQDENESMTDPRSQEDNERNKSNDKIHRTAEPLPEPDKRDDPVAMTTLSVGQGFTVSQTEGLPLPSLQPVRLTPNTNARDVLLSTPVRLTPQGSIALTPIKNLMPDNCEDEPADEQDSTAGPEEPPDNNGEIIMNLDSVCEGQRMKFSIPGKSQAITVNFSVEALQEMKNAALNNGGVSGLSTSDNQYSEISSSERSKEAETLLSNKISKKKNNKRNLRQKLKSNLKSPLKNAKEEENIAKPMNYLCPICSKTFTSENQLEKHQRFHVQKCFSCDICHEIFDKKWLYEQHLTERHGQQLEKSSCPECGKEFSPAHLLLAHIQSHHKKENEFRCFVCSLNFNKKHNLVTHLNSWHPQEKFPYCPVCMDIFNDKKAMETHDCPGAEIKNREIVCHLHQTPQRFTSRVELDNHMKEKHGTTEGSFNISCCICQKKFLLKNNLLKHLRNVHKQGDGNKHFCPTCGKQFYYKDDLRNHIPVHNGELSYKCSEEGCHKAYSTLKALKKHKKLTHEVDLSSITCKICNKKLSTKFKLKAHMLVHTNAKPFSCVHCSETFKEKRNVIKHIKLKHLKTVEEGAVTAERGNDEMEVESGESPNLKSDTELSSNIVENYLNINSNHNENDQPDSTDQTH